MIIRENLFYSLIFFFSYGIFAGGLAINTELEILYLISPIIFFILVLIFNKNDEILIEIRLQKFQNFEISNITYCLLIFLFLLFLVKDRIFLSIADDEYAYANLGLIHSNFLLSKISNFDLIKNIQIKYIFRFISFFILLSILIYLFLIEKIFKNKLIIKFTVIILTVFFLRVIINKFGGNAFPHPPLIGLFSLTSTFIFGLSDISLKFFPFIFYCFFSFYYFIKLKKVTNCIISFLSVISLFSIPGVLYLSSLLEQSLFSLLCFSLIALELSLNKNPNYKKLIILIVFFSFFRILSLLALILIVFHILSNSKSINDFFEKSFNTFKSSYPLILILPFIFFSFTNNSDLNVERLGVNFINLNFFLKDLPYTILNNFTFLPSFLILIFIFIFITNPKKNLFLIFFLLLSLVIYGNEIDKDNKYSYEIFFPIILSTFVFIYMNIKNSYLEKFLKFILILILVSNVFILKKFNTYCLTDDTPFKSNHNYKVRFGCNIIYAHPFELKNGFSFLKKKENFSFDSLYVPGVYYGILPSIINGMKVSEYQKHKFINSRQNDLNINSNTSWMSANSDNINNDKEINFILIADLKNPEKLTYDLMKLGWNEIYKKTNENFKTNIFILYKD